MPNKVLGQHFLKSDEDTKKIIEALDLEKGDKVIEVGPGRGEITKKLIEHKEISLKVVEKDKDLAKNLEEEFKNKDSNIEIIEGDILKLLHEVTPVKEKYKLTGNIPFYLTGKLLRDISDLKNKPNVSVFIIQKEVAERAVASPPNMNMLSASLKLWASPEIISTVPKGHFSPPPEVDGAIIKLKTKNYDRSIQKNYYSAMRVLFRHPRKTILNNLALDEDLNLEKDELREKVKEGGLEPGLRPQNLGVEEIKGLSRVLYN